MKTGWVVTTRAKIAVGELVEQGELKSASLRIGSIASPTLKMLRTYNSAKLVPCAWVLFREGAEWVPVDELRPHQDDPECPKHGPGWGCCHEAEEIPE